MASGDRTEARLGGPTQLGASTTTLCTVTSAHTFVVKQIIIVNTDTASRLVTLAIGSAATAANRIMSSLPVAANDMMIIDTALVLNSTETLEGLCDTASKVTVTLVGWDKTN